MVLLAPYPGSFPTTWGGAWVQGYGIMIRRDNPEIKMAATIKVHKWHARNVYARLVKGLYKPYPALPSASMSNGTANFAGEHR